ncbi:MAG TPA: porin [Ramlibacter sp.]|nr:porin [Ramlibacter sp.]
MRSHFSPALSRAKLRPLMALALITFASVASAQSSLTVFGVVDASVVRGTGSVFNKTQLFSGGLLGSRIGFRGVEDLGGGMAARVVFEGAIGADSGAGVPTSTNNQVGAPSPASGITFNRMSWVSLSSNWGELRLGRDYTPTFAAQAFHDPDSVGSGIWAPQSAVGSLAVLPNPAGVRASNSIGYLLPSLGGFSGRFMYAMGENASNSGATRKDGQLLGGLIGYSAGALTLNAAIEKIRQDAVGDITESVLGANYDFKMVKVWAQYLHDRTGLAGKMSGHSLAVTMPVDLLELRGAWSRSKVTNAAGAAAGTANKLAVAAIYNLSKRTAVYSTLAHVRNKDGAASVPIPGVAGTAANQKSSAVELGLKHSF